MKPAKPFLKWAGGKTQLIPEIEKKLKPIINKKERITFIEPFVGSGAVFIWALQNYNNIEKVVINDINTDLINSYKAIKHDHKTLLDKLSFLEEEYYKKADKETFQKEFFLDIRNKFNKRDSDKITHSAYLIFLNKTCFNGLYRVNKKNEFNVPFGKRKKPTICDYENIEALHILFQNVTILNDDYEKTIEHSNNYSVFYFDPPYKPLSETSSFNSYSKDIFDDNEQERLKYFCDKLTEIQQTWILSNSDLKNFDIENNFFDELYMEYKISRVKARRNINSKGSGRGKINELLITNLSL